MTRPFSRIKREGKRVRPEVRTHVDHLRVTTPCSVCGEVGWIEWHNPDHKWIKNRRVAIMVSLGYRLDAVLAEIATCQAVCRACHIKTDGPQPDPLYWRCGHPKEGNVRQSPGRHPRCLICDRQRGLESYHRRKY